MPNPTKAIKAGDQKHFSYTPPLVCVLRPTIPSRTRRDTQGTPDGPAASGTPPQSILNHRSKPRRTSGSTSKIRAPLHIHAWYSHQIPQRCHRPMRGIARSLHVGGLMSLREAFFRTATKRTLLVAAVLVAALFVALVVAYWAFDLGAVLPRRRP
jgi:hypothetical protein